MSLPPRSPDRVVLEVGEGLLEAGAAHREVLVEEELSLGHPPAVLGQEVPFRRFPPLHVLRHPLDPLALPLCEIPKSNDISSEIER